MDQLKQLEAISSNPECSDGIANSINVSNTENNSTPIIENQIPADQLAATTTEGTSLNTEKSSAYTKLSLERLQEERQVRLKAIEDREKIELEFIRKKHELLTVQLSFNGVSNADSLRRDEGPVDTIGGLMESASSETHPSSQPSTPAPLTNQQLAARQVMPQDLPIFSGDPEDWPVFISQYELSTNVCGYSNTENLIRLQRCLKGKALEYVRSQLLLPELVPQVIKTLEMFYGRPALIINALLEKVRNLSAPDPERLESFIDYGMAIQNLCDHLVAMKQQNHLLNPTLIQELEEKLPGNVKLDWARYKGSRNTATLVTLNNYMQDIVKAACQVTSFGTYQTDTSNTINEPNTSASSAMSNRHCLVCRDPNHQVQDCDEYKSADVSRRWNLVGELKLCRCCLNRHNSRFCNNAKRCGIERCELIHHPLLHQHNSGIPRAAAATTNSQ